MINDQCVIIISICGMTLHLKKHRKLYPRSSLSGGFLPAWQVRNLFSILIARVYQEINSDEPSWAIQNEKANSMHYLSIAPRGAAC